MTEQEAKRIAEQTIREVVNCMSDGKYDCIPEYAGISNDFPFDNFKETAEELLKITGHSHYDRYGTPIITQPKNSLYNQLSVIVYKNNTGFQILYDLTTDGKLNDITLIMEFLFVDDEIKPYILDIHVL